MMALELIEFMHTYHDKNIGQKILKIFLPYYCEFALRLCDFEKDPLHLIPQLSRLQPYVKYNKFQKLAIYYPRIYSLIRPYIPYYKAITNIERTIRKKLKNRKHRKKL